MRRAFTLQVDERPKPSLPPSHPGAILAQCVFCGARGTFLRDYEEPEIPYCRAVPNRGYDDDECGAFAPWGRFSAGPLRVKHLPSELRWLELEDRGWCIVEWKPTSAEIARVLLQAVREGRL